MLETWIILGGLLLALAVAWLWLRRARAESRGDDESPRLPGYTSLPGARGERSDQYTAGGGVGGAEGEGAPPTGQHPTDGGIGGAE